MSEASAAAAPAVRCPESATRSAVAWSGVVGLLLTVTLLNFWTPVRTLAWQGLMVMAVTALCVFAPDLLWQHVHRRTLIAPQAGSWPRTLTKLAGLAGSVGFIALLYWLFPEYSSRGFYASYWQGLEVVLPLWAGVSVPYLYWVDRRLREPRDALWQMGRVLLLHPEDASALAIGQHLLGWLVKGFYLPLMFTYFCTDLDKLLHYDLKRLHDLQGCFDWAYFTLYFIDVALVSMTYLMSLKLTDTHIRSAEPTVLGWLVALVCYDPFWTLIGGRYLAYDSGQPWTGWFGRMPWLFALWGAMILALVAIYVWSTIAFGARFSNLTHRGIITSGPYRYSKHPAYLAKNLSWWLIAMPFMIGVSAAQALRCCLLLCLLNGIYYLRAKTEERHLALDPVYRQYADWIARHGLLRALARLPLIGQAARWRPAFGAYRSPAGFTPQ